MNLTEEELSKIKWDAYKEGQKNPEVPSVRVKTKYYESDTAYTELPIISLVYVDGKLDILVKVP